MLCIAHNIYTHVFDIILLLTLNDIESIIKHFHFQKMITNCFEERYIKSWVMSTLSLVYCKKKDIKLVSFKQKIIIFKIKKQREILWFTCDIRIEIEIFGNLSEFLHFFMCTSRFFNFSFRWRTDYFSVLLTLIIHVSDLQAKHKRLAFSLFGIARGLSVFSETTVVF